MRAAFWLLAVGLLAGCGPTQSSLPVDGGGYPRGDAPGRRGDAGKNPDGSRPGWLTPLPARAVLFWHGAATGLPPGYGFCDGKFYDPTVVAPGQLGAVTAAGQKTVSTPDLGGRFLWSVASEAAGLAMPLGSASHTHSVAVDLSLRLQATTAAAPGGSELIGEHSHRLEIASQPAETMPPFVALHAIIKLGERPEIGVPSGAILAWREEIASIPAGYGLCDGGYYDPAYRQPGQIGSPLPTATATVKTPDLRGRFPLASGAAHPAGASGGSATHEHLVSGTSGEATSDNAGANTPSPAGAKTLLGKAHTHKLSATTSTASSLPVHQPVHLVMKLGGADDDLPPQRAAFAWERGRAALPFGYAICDGKYYDPHFDATGQEGGDAPSGGKTVQAPDLRGRFLVGAGKGMILGQPGGQASHGHRLTVRSEDAVEEAVGSEDKNPESPNPRAWTRKQHQHLLDQDLPELEVLPPSFGVQFLVRIR